MKKWKTAITGLLVLCLTVLMPFAPTLAEEEYAEEMETEAEDPIPESYYYPIESNEIKNWPQGPAIEAASATVMDMDSGTFLYSKNATSKQYPASITKIMTTLILLENCNLDDEITFSEIVYDIEEGSTHLGIQPGEKMTLRDAAYGIMLASANDISNGVAEYIGGSLSGFADLMNAKAQELGCVNTHFANPHGLYNEDHYTCAYDMALIATAAYQNPMFRKIVGTKEYTIPKTNLVDEERSFLNHHKMLQKDEEYYRSYCIGGKTGYTSQCLNTLVTFAQQDGMNLVSVIMRVNGAGKAYNETASILEYGFANFSTNNYKRDRSTRTFYDIMGLRYLGDASKFQSDVWKRTIYKDCGICITLPDTLDQTSLKYQVTENAGNSRTVTYQYEGTSVGASHGSFGTIYAPAQMMFEGSSHVVQAAAEGGAQNGSLQIESLNDVLDQTANIFTSGYDMLQTYASEHSLTVIVAGGVALVLLICLIVILVFRCTSESRIRRRRRQEERERKQREEEIERMTTAEIEAELRAGMQQEQMRKEQEMQAKAEAERAAAEAERLDAKAHETERLIQELEEERKQRSEIESKGYK